MLQNISKSAVWLTGFALVGAVTLSAVFQLTQPRIQANERMALLERLNTLVNAERYDNDPIQDKVIVSPVILGSALPVTVYRARKGTEPVAAIFETTAPDGYSGNIRLLVGVNADQTLAGVRVIAHKETPGLGDKIEIEKSNWITVFTGKSLEQPTEDKWAVKKDGGEFDQFSGATITPRAIVNATRRTLVYSKQHFSELFETTAAEITP